MGGNESCSESERQIFEMSRAANTKTHPCRGARASGRGKNSISWANPSSKLKELVSRLLELVSHSHYPLHCAALCSRIKFYI